jgi:hypothetical protein
MNQLSLQISETQSELIIQGFKLLNPQFSLDQLGLSRSQFAAEIGHLILKFRLLFTI